MTMAVLTVAYASAAVVAAVFAAEAEVLNAPPVVPIPDAPPDEVAVRFELVPVSQFWIVASFLISVGAMPAH